VIGIDNGKWTCMIGIKTEYRIKNYFKVINCHTATVFEHQNMLVQLNYKWLQEAVTATMGDDAMLDGDGLRSTIKHCVLICV
jgi:hypothetical protein